MFAVVQVPLTDVRRFVAGATGRIDKPSWPLAEPDREFVRAFGVVRQRRRGGAGTWVGEDQFATANRAARLAPVPDAPEVVKFRRLFNDGNISVRLEVGFGERYPSENGARLQESAFRTLVRNCLDRKIDIPSKSEVIAVRLGSYGGRLAQRYLGATTLRQNGQPGVTEPWWVDDGRPMVVVEYQSDVQHQLPAQGRSIARLEKDGIELSHFWADYGGQTTGVWLLGYSLTGSNSEQVRRLRLHLLRLHALRESLKYTLRCVRAGRLAVGGKGVDGPLDEYLDAASKDLDKAQRFGVPQEELLAAYAAEEIVTPDQIPTLSAEVEKLRRAPAERLLGLITSIRKDGVVVELKTGETHVTNIDNSHHTTITNSTVTNSIVGTTITNATNAIGASNASAEIKATLQEYLDLINQMDPKLKADDQATMAQSVDVLAKQATAEKPQSNFVKFAVEQIETIAETVEDVGPKVIAIGKKLLPLLGVLV